MWSAKLNAGAPAIPQAKRPHRAAQAAGVQLDAELQAEQTEAAQAAPATAMQADPQLQQQQQQQQQLATATIATVAAGEPDATIDSAAAATAARQCRLVEGNARAWHLGQVCKAGCRCAHPNYLSCAASADEDCDDTFIAFSTVVVRLAMLTVCTSIGATYATCVPLCGVRGSSTCFTAAVATAAAVHKNSCLHATAVAQRQMSYEAEVLALQQLSQSPDAANKHRRLLTCNS